MIFSTKNTNQKIIKNVFSPEYLFGDLIKWSKITGNIDEIPT